MSSPIQLSHCMVDGDAGMLKQARRFRQKALVLSATFEMAMIGALLLWPLFSPAVLSRPPLITPIPPFHGISRAQTIPEHSATPTAASTNLRPVLYPPVHRNFTILNEPNDSEPPTLESSWSGPEGGRSVIPGEVDVLPLPPRPETNSHRPIRRGGDVMEALLIQRTQPIYPAIAKMTRLSGQVKLLAIIRVDGSVGEMTVLSGSPILAVAAKSAVAEWRYRPTMLNGQPVEVETTVTVNFILN